MRLTVSLIRAGCLGLLLGMSVGCSSIEEVRTTPPRAAVPPPDTTVEVGVPVAVTMEVLPPALPDDVASLQFRAREVWLHTPSEGWTSYPADVHQFVVEGSRPERRSILSSRVPPARYDSIGVVLEDVYVTFDPHAGSPLTMPRGEPFKVPVSLSLREQQPARIQLLVDAEASLWQDDRCRWFFVPFITVEVQWP